MPPRKPARYILVHGTATYENPTLHDSRTLSERCNVDDAKRKTRLIAREAFGHRRAVPCKHCTR